MESVLLHLSCDNVVFMCYDSVPLLHLCCISMETVVSKVSCTIEVCIGYRCHEPLGLRASWFVTGFQDESIIYIVSFAAGNFSNVGYSRRSIECGIAKDIPLKNYRVEHQTSLNASEVNAFEAGSRNQNVGRVCQGGELLREALPILFYNYVPFRFYF